MTIVSRQLIGDTVKIRWVNSGSSPTTVNAAVFNGSETLVDSGAMTSSGSGLYYYLHTVPNTPGYYVVETNATVNGLPYKRRIRYQAVLEDID